MPLSTVLASISWRAPGNQWPLIGLPVGDVTDQGALTGFITAAYASGIAAGLMDQAAATGIIRIGASGASEPGTYSGYFDTPGSYLGLNSSAIDKLHYFNTTGTFVKEKGAITVAHEFVHFVLKGTYADPTYSEAAMNGAAYDFDHPIITKQNEISTQLGELNNLQVSYFSSVMQGFDSRFNLLTVGQSYTDNKGVDVVRLGDMTGGTADNIDHSLRSAKLNDLLFGFSGDDTIKAGKGDDYAYGGGGKDKLWGGDGDDVLVGEDADDEFRGEKGDDVIWGGLKDFDFGTADGTDLVDYSAVVFAAGATNGIAVDFNAVTKKMTVSDGESGTDTLASIEKVIATAKHDTFTFSGNGTNARIDMTDLQDGFAKAEEGGQVVRVKDFNEFIGGANLTTFIGNGVDGRDTIFRAGAGGGDFTLKSGNRAWGHDDAVDTFRVITTVPTELSGLTTAEKIEYLRNNRIFIGNFDENDQLYVDGVLFNGNQVTSTIAPAMPVQPNNDSHTTTIWLNGTSSWNVQYPHAQHEVRGTNDSSYVYGSNHSFRDVSYQVVEDGDPQTTLGLISFDGRTGHAGTNAEDFELNELSVSDAMLRVVIGDFEDGHGGISFTHDTLSATPFISGLEGNINVDTPDVTDPMRLSIVMERDVIDGTQDGYAYGGGATVNSDSENFNFGDGVTLGAGGVNAYVLGAEELTGTEAPDILTGGPGDDVISGLGGNDQLAGGTGNDLLDGGEGDDELAGGDGDDALKGGAGQDAMAGGLGDDTYEVDDGDDEVTELADAGNDTIVTSLASYALTDHLENLFHDGAEDFTGTGTAVANRLGGGAGNDTLTGDDGDDILYSSLGEDEMDGGDGHDMLSLAGYRYGFDISRDGAGVITVTEIEGLEREIVLTSVEAIHFEEQDETWSLDDLFGYFGTAGDDLIEGSDVDNQIFGLGGNDTLLGHGGSDLIDGGTGTDSMTGHDGHDTYIVDDSGDSVTEAADEGFDTVVSSLTYTLGANLELLELAAGAGAINGTGNALDNALYGNESANTLTGGDGDDELDGGEGADTMVGGVGSDLYYVDNAGDVVTEGLTLGIDEVYTSLASYTLATNVERLIGLLDTGQALTGNGSANLIVGGAGADTISGGLGSDTASWFWFGNGVSVDLQSGATGGDAAGDVLVSIENLTGGWGDDTLSGTSSANVLDGGGGIDVMTGRGGNDIYYVDDEDDQVVEVSGQGNDEVRTTLAVYAIVANTEVLRFVGEGGFVGTGGDGSDTIHGGVEGDLLDGGAGYDYLTGGGGEDLLIGGADGDTLDGGAGADEMEGGTGNDNYTVDNAGDVVVEASGEGTDLVYSTLASYVLADEVENLTGSSYSAQTLTGNGLGNLIWAGTAADTANGGGGDDELRGNGGDDTLNGGDGADLLVGSAGVDTQTGGDGADTFRFFGWDSVTGAADRITDFVSGVDTIDLAGVDAGFWTGGDQAFTFIGNAAFSAQAGELRYGFNGTDTYVKGDWDGDGAADLIIILSGEVVPLATDFIL